MTCLVTLIDNNLIHLDMNSDYNPFLNEILFFQRIQEDTNIDDLETILSSFDDIFTAERIPDDDLLLLSRSIATENIDYITLSCKIFKNSISFVNETLNIYEEPLLLAIMTQNIDIFNMIVSKIDNSCKVMPSFIAQCLVKQDNDDMFKELFENRHFIAEDLEWLRIICKEDRYTKLLIAINCFKDDPEISNMLNFAMIEAMNNSALKCEEIIITSPFFSPNTEVVKASVHRHVTKDITLKLISMFPDKLILPDNEENLLQQATRERMSWIIEALLKTNLFDPDEPKNSLNSPRIIAETNHDAVILSIFNAISNHSSLFHFFQVKH